MKVIMLGNDPTIFDEGSPARTRMQLYAAVFGELHIISSAKRNAHELQEGALYLHPVHTSKLLRISSLSKKAKQVIEKYGIEVISAQDPFEHGLAALRAISGTTVKLHIQVHTDFLSPWFTLSGNMRAPKVRPSRYNKIRQRIANRVLPHANGIRVVSERIKESLIKKYKSHIPVPTVIPIAVPITVPSPVALPPHSFKFSLIAVGRLEPEKRIEDILVALSLIHGKYPMVGLFIVGEGSERSRLEKMVNELQLQENVIFLGNRSDAWGLMQSAHAFIQASAYEGAQRTLMEASLASVPIITTDVGIVGEVFRGYEDVLSVPVSDPTALSYSIIGLIEDGTLRISLPAHAKNAMTHYIASVDSSPQAIADNIASLLA